MGLPFQEVLNVRIESAGKREEQIRDIPASVTLITRDEIARYGWATFEELLRNVPGFYLLDNTEDRFIGTRGTAFGGVQVLVNGIPHHPSLQKTLTATEIARLDIPVESIDRVEIIRGPMSVIYGNNAFQGVINVVTNRIDRHGPRVSASVGSRDSGRLFARLGADFRDGFAVLNAGAYRTDGLDGDYADMLSAAQQAALPPGWRHSMDGHLDQTVVSLDLSAAWQGWQANLRYNQRDYGLFAFTPPFGDGTRVRLDTWQAAMGFEHRFSDDLGLHVTGIYSAETYDAYQMDLLLPGVRGNQQQTSRRWELEVDLHWRPRPDIDALMGYRYRHIDDVSSRVDLLPLIDAERMLDPVTTHELFGQASWRLMPRLRVIGGARLSLLPERYRQTADGSSDLAPAVVDSPVKDAAPVNGQLAVIWTPGAGQAVKLTWGTASQDVDQINVPDAERIDTLELNLHPGWGTLAAERGAVPQPPHGPGAHHPDLRCRHRRIQDRGRRLRALAHARPGADRRGAPAPGPGPLRQPDLADHRGPRQRHRPRLLAIAARQAQGQLQPRRHDLCRLRPLCRCHECGLGLC
jgi:outer membrane receptor protein involved in Fe transport